MLFEKEVPNLKIFTYERLDWLKRASSLPRLQSSVAADKVSVDKIAVIELFFPSVFRAVFSLHPVGSIDPDAVAFFRPDEVHAVTALQCFLGISVATFMIQVQGCVYLTSQDTQYRPQSFLGVKRLHNSFHFKRKHNQDLI
ncbi:hypothetical protein LWI29_007641 [Acer saccharum]|uniref:Uncharacterized protein n=1 Tax=Acer saccharum TaxID=4024 RepID=A0AA39S6E9_ACESA|nr:hypothetical protein LWI29_007641 [Acer saccharum]